MQLHLNLDNLIDFLIFENDVFQPEVTDTIERILTEKKYDFFIDVGSHIGQMSLFVAKHFPSVDVISFEANPVIAKRQSMNMRLNDINYHMVNKAVSDTCENITFFIDKKRYIQEYFKINDGKYTASKQENTKFAFKQESITLDEFWKKNNIKYNSTILLKLDVEAWELHVLRGAESLLQHNHVIIITELLWAENDSSCIEIIQFLKKFNYVLYDIHLNRLNEYPSHNGDFIFIK